MPSPRDIESALAHVKDQESLLHLLGDTLEWPNLDDARKLEDLAYGWTADELRAQDLDQQLLDGQIWQLQLQPGQPWGIFVVEFAKEKVYRTSLRKVLRGLVPSRQRSSNLPAWKHENLLFICATRDYKQLTFAQFRGDKAQQARLATFGWQQGDRHVRTVCEFNLERLGWPGDSGRDGDKWLKQWAGAFDVEEVTKRFFAEYAKVFADVEEKVRGVPKGEVRRLYVQRLFNRLMFLYFIQRKGWLAFQGDKNYLRALFDAAVKAKEDFLNERLYWAFFQGLNTAGEDSKIHKDSTLQERRGTVPFLNGGLFDLEDEYDQQDKVHIPNAAFAGILELFERYNFTVTESTPFDIEVAVDPEMLGKVFEELVTGRHESGSYYTPRPIVAFMCREALKHYLRGASIQASLPRKWGEVARGDSAPPPADAGGSPEQNNAVARFVDDGDPSLLRDPEAVLNALRNVKVCDPACGSGAYLLGMMQELLRLREALFAVRQLDHSTVYDRKLEIIQNNLYGVDLDLFAVNIAKLRLWLSLAVDYVGKVPPPLPNLDFKIERGDSLTAPDPQAIPDLFRELLVRKADELASLKADFLKTYGAKKKKLNEQIKKEEASLRESLHEQVEDGCVDWRVAFAEVFRNGGFDVALENPPYVRMELFKDAKPILKRNFPQVYDGTADLYVYFFARTFQILRPGGTASFISSNKWLKAGYGESLRRFFSTSASVASVVDFGHAKQIFQEADVFPSILVLRKPTSNAIPLTIHVCAIPREKLRLDDLTRQVQTEGFEVPRERFGAEAWTLEPPGVIALLEKIRRAGVPLKQFSGVDIFRGVTTGLNEAFLIDGETKAAIVAQDRKSAEIIKPYLRGQDVGRWVPDWDGTWMIFSRRGIDINLYPAVKRHLSQFVDRLKPKPPGWDGDWNGRKPGPYAWFEIQDSTAYWQLFEQPKIFYQEIQYYPAYALGKPGVYGNNKTSFIPADDLYLLGVLNSPLMWWHNWRFLPHMKDEALAPLGFKMEDLPIAKARDGIRATVVAAVARLLAIVEEEQKRRSVALDWLRVKFDIDKPSQKLQDVAALNEDALVAEVQKARGKSKPLSAAQVKALKDEHVRSVRPLQALAAEARQLERRLADLVNEAYGLTPEEVELMWRTAPPRMPGERPG